MPDPKSMERLVARFESNRDKSTIHLLYSFWCDELEPLALDDLPSAYDQWKSQRPFFRVQAEEGYEGLIIIASNDQLAKGKVLETCRIAALTFQDELENHGFAPDPSVADPEANWFKALVMAATHNKLGHEGFEPSSSSTYVQQEISPEDSIDDIEWCDEDLLPRGYIAIRNVAEASLVLMDRLSKEPEAPKQTRPRGQDTNERLKALYFEDRFFCLTHSITEIAKRIERSISQVSKAEFWQDVIQPEKEANGLSRKRLEKLRQQRDQGYSLSDDEERRLSFLDSVFHETAK